MTVADLPAVERFIARWQAAGGSERANYQLFVGELCELLDLPRPDPVREGQYLLVDDFVGQGGTLANLKGFIEHRGALVVGATN